MRRKIAILSDGGWGTALALLLCRNGHDVRQWGPFPNYIDEMRAFRKNPRFLPGIELPSELLLTGDMEEAVKGAEVIVLASPSQYLRGVLEKFQPYFQPERQLIVNVAKGIENETLLRMSEVTALYLGECRYAVLSGPSHAEEVSRAVPTAVVVASRSRDHDTPIAVQKLFMNPNFRVYTSNDLVGVELGGALKNVYAIAAGIVDGMKLGDNPKAALMTRAVAEMARLGTALGGKPDTFSGLSGIGDMIVTCCSGHSRNRHVGEELGRGKSMTEIRKAMGLSVAEGVPTALAAWRISQRHEVDAPIIEQVHNILYRDMNPINTIAELMGRKARSESEGYGE